MARIEAEVLDQFFETLAEHEAVNESVIGALQAALSEDRLPRAESLVALFANSSGDKLA
jgi:hypothetical protein